MDSAPKATPAPQTMSADVRLFALIPRRPDISVDEFHQHWENIHAPLALKIESLRAYTQNHVVPHRFAGVAPASYDGISEAWFDTIGDDGRPPHHSERTYQEGARRDEARFMDLDNRRYLPTAEHLLTPTPAPAGDVKVLVLIKRTAGWTADDFRSAMTHQIPRAAKLRGAVECRAWCTVLRQAYQQVEPAYDAVAEIGAMDIAALEGWWHGPDAARTLGFGDSASARMSMALLVDPVSFRVRNDHPAGR